MKRKSGCLITIGVLLTFLGPIFLIRSCLAKLDEFSIDGSICLSENKSSPVIVYIKNYYDVKSYSQDGGVTSIGGNHKYFLETRDASTLQLIKSTRLKTDDLQFPKIVGNSDKIIWIHNGQLLGYDPLTHEVICTETKLAQLTPALLNNFPTETQYYKYDYQNNQLDVFTKNAIHYKISENFKAILSEDDDQEPAEITQLKNRKKDFEDRQKSSQSSNYFTWYDSIRPIEKQIEELKNEIQYQKDFREKVTDLHNGNLVSLNNLIASILVKDSTIYALTPKKEIDTANHYIYLSSNFSIEEQKLFSKANIKEVSRSSGMYNSAVVEKQVVINAGLSFLKGHFLLNKKTLQAIILHNPESFLVLSTKEIGQNSPLILHRVDFSGKILWTKQLPVKSLKDIAITPHVLVILSEKDDYLSEDKQSDILLSVDLKTGNFLLEALK